MPLCNLSSLLTLMPGRGATSPCRVLPTGCWDKPQLFTLAWESCKASPHLVPPPAAHCPSANQSVPRACPVHPAVKRFWALDMAGPLCSLILSPQAVASLQPGNLGTQRGGKDSEAADFTQPLRQEEERLGQGSGTAPGGSEGSLWISCMDRWVHRSAWSPTPQLSPGPLSEGTQLL